MLTNYQNSQAHLATPTSSSSPRSRELHLLILESNLLNRNVLRGWWITEAIGSSISAVTRNIDADCASGRALGARCIGWACAGHRYTQWHLASQDRTISTTYWVSMRCAAFCLPSLQTRAFVSHVFAIRRWRLLACLACVALGCFTNRVLVYGVLRALFFAVVFCRLDRGVGNRLRWFLPLLSCTWSPCLLWKGWMSYHGKCLHGSLLEDIYHPAFKRTVGEHDGFGSPTILGVSIPLRGRLLLFSVSERLSKPFVCSAAYSCSRFENGIRILSWIRWKGTGKVLNGGPRRLNHSTKTHSYCLEAWASRHD